MLAIAAFAVVDAGECDPMSAGLIVLFGFATMVPGVCAALLLIGATALRWQHTAMASVAVIALSIATTAGSCGLA